MDNPAGSVRAVQAGWMTGWRVAGLAVTAWVVALALLLPSSASEPAAEPPDAPTAATAASAAGPATPRGDRAELGDAVEVLRAWDARRAAAWAAGDTTTLRTLYVAGSRAAAADVVLLERWLRAGWRVEGLRSQVLAVAVVRATAGRLVLRVVDRVAGGTVVERTSGAQAGALPGSTTTTRTLELRRGPSGWVVASSRLVGTP